MPQLSHTVLPLTAVTLFLSAPLADAASIRNGIATARYRSGNVNLDEQSFADPIDFIGTTGPQSVAKPKASPPDENHIEVEAESSIDQSLGVMRTYAKQRAATDFPADIRGFNTFGGGNVTLGDTITVCSDTLANGTPVDITFAIAIAWNADATTDFKTLPTTGNNNVAYQLNARFSANAGLDGSFQLQGNDNQRNFVTNPDLPGAPVDITNGLFAGPAYAEFTLSTTVGKAITYGVSVDVDVFGTVLSINNFNPEMMSFAELVGVYGAEASIDGVDLCIDGPDGVTTLSGLSNVNSEYAASFLTTLGPTPPPAPGPQPIPQPAAAALFFAACLPILGRRNR